MKFCDTHWQELRKLIDDRGLSGLVAKNGQEVAGKMAAEINKGEVDKANFDPLMGAHNALVGNALAVVGFELLIDNEDGTQKCPMCHLVKLCECGRGDACEFLTWPAHAADDQLATAKELGLVGTS